MSDSRHLHPPNVNALGRFILEREESRKSANYR